MPGKTHIPGRSQRLSRSTDERPRFSIITTNRNSTTMAPAYTTTSRAAANGAPRTKKITATASRETTR